MTPPASLVLVTAGFGNRARQLIPLLSAKGRPVRALRRSGAGAAAVRALGAAEVVVGDIADPDVLAAAMDCVDCLYHVGQTPHPHEAEVGVAAVDASVAAGVRPFVYASVLHARISALVQPPSDAPTDPCQPEEWMSPITYDYSGRAALVTGAAQGIGEAAALLLARAGFGVAVADIDLDGARHTASEIQAAGGAAEAIQADIGDADEVEAMVEFAVRRFGRLDAAVNNAAIPQRYSLDPADSSLIEDMPLQDWDELIRVNLNGPFYCVRFEVRAMRRNAKGGSIVNLSSSGAVQALAGMAGYCATKKGVLGLTEAAAVENARHNIRVNAVLPGRARTTMNVATMRDNDPEAGRKLDATAPLNRAAQPSELGEAILWLCSDASSYVTGHSLVVDGGTTIRHPRSAF